jgi:hypothetical protein
MIESNMPLDNTKYDVAISFLAKDENNEGDIKATMSTSFSGARVSFIGVQVTMVINDACWIYRALEGFCC